MIPLGTARFGSGLVRRIIAVLGLLTVLGLPDLLRQAEAGRQGL